MDKNLQGTEDDLRASEATTMEPETSQDSAKSVVSIPKGYFVMDNQQSDAAPEQLLDAPPKGKRYGEVFQDGVICVQMENIPFAKRIIKILDDTKVHYKAISTMNYLRLFFKGDFGTPIHNGFNMTGMDVEMCGTKGYIEHTGGNWKMLHEDTELSELPDWLYPAKSVDALYSKTSMLGQSQWIEYVTPIFQKYGGNNTRQRKLAYKATIEAALILNQFRKTPFNEVKMIAFLDIMEFTKPNFYVMEADSRGREKKVFLKDAFAEWFIERYKLINLDYLPYAYSNGIYRYMSNEEMETLLLKHLPNTTDSFKKEVRKSVCALLGVYTMQTSSKMDQAFDVAEASNPNLIAFNNGVLDIKDGSMRDFSPKLHVTNRIPYDYVDFGPMIDRGEKTEAMKIIDNWLDSFSEYNQEKRKVLEEVAGLCMYKKNVGLRRQHTILTGSAESGKSTYLSMLIRLIGEENTSYCSIEEICNLNSRFTVINMVNKSLNVAADVSKRGIWEASRLKNLCTSDPVYVEQKGQPMFEMRYYGKMVFGCNELPTISDNAIPSRFEFIPCNANFSSLGNKCIPNLFDDYLTREDSMTYWCYLAVEGLKRFISQGYRHTYCAENEELRRNYHKVVNPVKAFVDSREEETWLNKNINDVYEMYMDFIIKDLKLSDRECALETNNSLTRAIKRLGYDTKRQTKDGRKCTVYVSTKIQR